MYTFVFYSTDSEKITFDNVKAKKIPFAFLYQVNSSGESSFVGIIIEVRKGTITGTIILNFPGITPADLVIKNFTDVVTEV